MTNEEHWTQAKDAVAKKYGSFYFQGNADGYNEAASIMAEAIRGEYEVDAQKLMAERDRYRNLCELKDERIADLERYDNQ